MKVFIIGSGSWGTALANVLADNCVDVLLYGRNEKEVNEINESHFNSRYFPGIELNENLRATDNLALVSDADCILLAVPSTVCTQMIEKMNPYLKKQVVIINVAKGFHPVTFERLSVEITKAIRKDCFKAYCSLVGPSFAEEVINRQHTTINMVSENIEVAKQYQKIFANSYFRVYTNDDLIGAEYASGLKNVIAIASGILHGLNLGNNAKASLLTRGLAEMKRFAVRFGAKNETFMGLCGMGDLILTCTSEMSRNFSAGYRIGTENSSKGFWEENRVTVEGVEACRIIHFKSLEIGVEMPITNEVYKVLFEDKKPSEALKDLMNRDLKPENYEQFEGFSFLVYNTVEDRICISVI